jgi:peptide/nickel transport system substrate-binding protein
MSNNYWDKVLNKRLTRRRAITATGTTAAAAAFLAACGGDDDDDSSSSGSSSSGSSSSGGSSSSSGGSSGGTSAAKVGGHMVWQGYGDPGGGLELIKSRNAGVNQLASLINDRLLYFAYGTAGNPGIGFDVLPNLATALPEISPDKLTFTFKLHEGVKFSDGKDLTSEDVLWTFDTKKNADESAYKNDYAWLDGFEAPDATTFVIHANRVNADLMASLAFKNEAGILNRVHQESAAAESSFLGSGPYKFVEYSPPTVMKYERWPEHWDSANAGWIESIDRLGTSDQEKKVSDLISKQVDVTYWFAKTERERILAERKDLQVFQYPGPDARQIYMRNDVAPFNDKRVRQAISMSYDRQLAIENVRNGDGMPDQALGRSGEAWEFRGPEDLPNPGLYELNVAEAMKLLSAANVSTPIKAQCPTWNATVVGQEYVDEIVLMATQMRANGIADFELIEETFGQFGPRFTGTYDTVQWGPNVTTALPDLGINIYNKYHSDDGKVPSGPPTFNICYMNNAELDGLLEAQVQEFDREKRISIFRQMEDLLSDEMPHVSGVTFTLAYFADPRLKNAQMPRDAYNGETSWMRYWYIES